MSHCININHNEVKELSTKTGIPKIIIAAKIALWQENNTMDRFPTIKELGFITKDIEQELKDTKFFSQHNDMLFIKKHSYIDAIKVIAKYNKETPGLITVKKAQNFGAGDRKSVV